ncbi:MAG TPA: ABC transporter permease subunit [Thermoplasmatales archaeon]|nr:ABC transporter permease subunit [Thermoplasmatales archaeon]
MNRRHLEQQVALCAMYGALVMVVVSLLLIIGVTVLRGGHVLVTRPEVVVTPPGPRYLLGGGGGFVHAILGSLYLVLPATLLASGIAMGIALYLQSDYTSRRTAGAIRNLLDALWGTPSIVYGMFVLTILISLQQRASLLAGIAALTLLEIPIIARYADAAVQAVPPMAKETSYALGTTRWENSQVVIRYALPGIATGVLIGLGRGIGDAASVIFTAGAGNNMPSGLLEGVTALPVLIFQQASSFYPSVREQAYAASFVLIVIVLVLNVASRLVTNYFARYIPGGR